MTLAEIDHAWIVGLMGGDTRQAHHGMWWWNPIAWAWQSISPHHIQLFRHGLFSASVIFPKTAFTFDVLDHFYMDAMECKTTSLSFSKSWEGSQIMQPQHLFLLVFITHHSLWLAHWWIISEPLQRAATCVPPVWNLQAWKGLSLAMDRAKTLAQMIWLCFAQLAYNQAQSSRGLGIWFKWVSALVFGHVMGVASCLVFLQVALGENWWQMGTSFIKPYWA